MQRIVKVRKEHKCHYCEKIIPVGSKAILIEDRCPKYNGADIQAGINYYRGYECETHTHEEHAEVIDRVNIRENNDLYDNYKPWL